MPRKIADRDLVIAEIDLEKIIREHLRGSGFDDQNAKTKTPTVKFCECGKEVRNGTGWRYKSQHLCNRCGYKLVHSLQSEPLVISKLYCAECQILFRAIQSRAGGRRIRFCSERCSNTDRQRRARANKKGRPKPP